MNMAYRNEFIAETNNKARQYQVIIEEIKEMSEDTELNIPENLIEDFRKTVFAAEKNINGNNIDFWDEKKCPIAKPIKESFSIEIEKQLAKLIESFSKALNKIEKYPKILRTKKRIDTILKEELNPTIIKMNELNDFIRNYEIHNDIATSIYVYYEDTPSKNWFPGKITESYKEIKEFLQQINLSKELEEHETEILELINKKEFECEEEKFKTKIVETPKELDLEKEESKIVKQVQRLKPASSIQSKLPQNNNGKPAEEKTH